MPSRANAPSTLGHVLGRVVVAAELVRQAGVRVARDAACRAMRASSATCGRMSSAPSAQLMLTANRFAWLIELKNASTVWPDSVRPRAIRDRDRRDHRHAAHALRRTAPRTRRAPPCS